MAKKTIILQKYLNEKYPTKRDKEKVKEIVVYQLIKDDKEVKLIGKELDLSEYPNLEKIEIDGKNDLESGIKSLKLGSKPKLKNLYCSNNHLTKLDLTNCPALEAIVCDGNKKITELKLGQLINLTKLDCEDNKIEELNIQNCPNLKHLACSYNLMTNLDLSQNPKIETLKIRDNNFSEQDLSFLEHLLNLKLLWIDNINKDERIEDGVYNRFAGSLEPLKGMNKLKDFRFSDTDLDSGLECLPKSLQRLECAVKFRTDAKVKVIKEELEEYGKSKDLDNFAHLLPVWKEFSSPAKEWLDENYPANEVCQRREDEKNYKKKREEIINLDISKQQNLKKGLKLKGFTNLKRLNCSNNQLTNLDLSHCPNLIELDCSNNELTNLNFLKLIDKLEQLNIGNCPVKGSLKPLADLSKLKELNISNTELSEGLEYLSENCKKIYCNSDYQHKSVKLMKELDKSNCSEEEIDKEGEVIKYYNLDEWREYKEDGRAASIIPLERLYVIRGNIRKFISKWGKETEESWYEQFFAKLEVNELSNLQSPKEFGIYRYTKSAKWIARAGAVSGGVLALADNSVIGGAFATVFPFVEILASNAEEELYAAKQKKWDEFINDAENLLDNYHELLGILEQVKRSELGKVNQALNDLRDKVKLFLDAYDEPRESGEEKNGVIDLLELINKKKELGADLSNEKPEGGGSQLGDIVLAMKKLEEEVIDYRQGSSKKEMEDKSEENQEDNSQRGSSHFDDRSSAPILNDQGSNEDFLSIINIFQDDDVSNQEQLETQIEMPPYGTPGSSKK